MNRIIYLALLMLTFNATASQLPFLEPFEAANNVTNGTINGQNGWILENGTANVQSAVSQAGTQALEIQGAKLSHSLSNSEASVWLNFQARITSVPDADPAVTNANTSVAFFVNTNLNLVVYSNQTPITLNATMQTNVWTRFDVYCDYDNLKWTLSVNGTNVAENLTLYSASRQIESLQIVNDSIAPLYFDELAVQNTEPESGNVDTDRDGIPDWWEQKYSGGVTNLLPGILSSQNGLTYLQGYIAGIAPDIADSFETSRIPGTHNGMRWATKPGRIYDVEWTPDLTTAFIPVATGIPWTQTEFIDNTNTNAASGFYRIRARMAH